MKKVISIIAFTMIILSIFVAFPCNVSAYHYHVSEGTTKIEPYKFYGNRDLTSITIS